MEPFAVKSLRTQSQRMIMDDFILATELSFQILRPFYEKKNQAGPPYLH